MIPISTDGSFIALLFYGQDEGIMICIILENLKRNSMPSKFISNGALREVLKQATDDERLSLTKILDSDRSEPYSYIKLQEEICDQGGHSVVSFFRGQGTGYLDIVDDVADELKIRNIPSYMFEVKYFDEIENLRFSKEEARKKGEEYALKTEEKIILKLLEMVYEQLDETKKEEFDRQINKVAQKFDSNITKGLSGTAGLMTLGNLGGFATYTFLTTSLSTISMGTLGFGAYTAATSLLSVVLGPIGWAGLGIAGVFALGRPSYAKLMPIVAIVGAIRQRIKYGHDEPNKKQFSKKGQEKMKKNKHKKSLISDRMYSKSELKNVKLPTLDDIEAYAKEDCLKEKDIWFINKNKKRSVWYIGRYESYPKPEKTKAYLIDTSYYNSEELFDAFKKSPIDIKKIKQLIEEDVVLLNKKNEYGYTILFLAIEHSCKEIIEFLIGKNVDLDIQDNSGNTALMLSSQYNYKDIVKLLLKKGAKSNIFNEAKQSALMIASKNNNIEIVKLLIEKNPEANEKNEFNHTALHIAAEEGYLKIVKILLKNSEDADMENNIGLTPLSSSILTGSIDVTKYLFSKIKPHIDKKYKNDFTLLMWATIGGNKEIVNFLIENEADINIKNKDGMTALMWASIRGHYNIVKFLIENKAHINIKNKDGMTALIYAKNKKHNDIVMLLSGNNHIPYHKPKLNNKIKTISFNNFKAFGNKKQTFNKKPITLIYGANSVGKSSLIYLIAYIKNLHNSKNIDSIVIDKFGDKIDTGGIEKFIYQRDINNIIEIEISIEIEKENDLKICYEIDIKNLLLNIVYKKNNETLATQIIKYSKEYIEKENNIEYKDEKNKKIIDLIDKTRLKMQYIGPSRPALQRDYDFSNQDIDNQYNSENLWALLSDDKDILDKVNEKLKLLGMNYLVKTYIDYNLDKDFEAIINDSTSTIEELQELEGKHRVVFKDINNANIEISNLDLGFGVSQVLPILIAATKYNNIDIAVEQPELHLHPKLQMDLADNFIKSYKENNNQFIIETHSEHILLRIMKRMRHTAEDKPDRDKSLDLTPDDVCLLYVDSDDKSTWINELELDTDGVLLDPWPNGFFEEGSKERFE